MDAHLDAIALRTFDMSAQIFWQKCAFVFQSGMRCGRHGGKPRGGLEKWYNKFTGCVSGDLVSGVGERFWHPTAQ